MHVAHYHLIIIVLLYIFMFLAVYLLVPSAEGGWELHTLAGRFSKEFLTNKKTKYSQR